jgi:hypothetical protein
MSQYLDSSEEHGERAFGVGGRCRGLSALMRCTVSDRCVWSLSGTLSTIVSLASRCGLFDEGLWASRVAKRLD